MVLSWGAIREETLDCVESIHNDSLKEVLDGNRFLQSSFNCSILILKSILVTQ